MVISAKIQAMKKSIPKGDKKRKKEVTAEISQLEQEMEEQHKRELEAVEIEIGLNQSQDKLPGVVEHLVEQLEAVEVGGGAGGGDNGEAEGEQRPVKKSRAQEKG